jgi:integral membrane protein (TIGR01906 family)
VAANLGGAVVSLAVAIVILGVTVPPFMTPAWMASEQGRAGASALTGYAAGDLRTATDAIVHDLVLGGDFDVAVAGQPVLDADERAHMRDVRGAFAGFGVVVLAAGAVLALAAWRTRGAARLRAWSAVRRGATSLTILLVVLGVIAIVAFDAALEVFHQLLFPGGNYAFDPGTEKLVQLFPIQFWSDTALAYGGVAIGLALLVAWFAGRRAGFAARRVEALSRGIAA